METTFTFNTMDFKKMMTEVRKLSKRSYTLNTTISVQPDRLEFQFVGISRFIKAETSTYCDVVIPFRLLDNTAKTETSKEMTWIVKDGEIQFGKLSVKNNSIRVQSLFVNPPLPLAMNQDSLSILRLRLTHKEAQLTQLKLLESVEGEEKTLEIKLKEAGKCLYPYGVTVQMLRELVAKNL